MRSREPGEVFDVPMPSFTDEAKEAVGGGALGYAGDVSMTPAADPPPE
jgi:hypothetical protein